ncbi:MAG: outer membrane beta-barrel protein [Acidobacteriota bacterium]
MSKWTRWMVPLALFLAVTLSLTPTAWAQSRQIEVFAGTLSVDSELLDDDTVYGVRGAQPINDQLSIRLGLTSFSSSESRTVALPPFPTLPIPLPGQLPTSVTVRVDTDILFFDASAVWYPSWGNGAFSLYGGPGWAFVDAEASASTTVFGGLVISDAAEVSDDSLTLHAGVGYEIELGPSFYLRPDVKARWIEELSGTDFEGSLALGYRFGF